MSKQNHRYPRILLGALFLTYAFAGNAGAETEQRLNPGSQTGRPAAAEQNGARIGDSSPSGEVKRGERDAEQTLRPDRTHARDRRHRDSK
jgi:hypothetical protein